MASRGRVLCPYFTFDSYLRGERWVIVDFRRREKIARVRSHGQVTHITTATGARLDVMPEPPVPGCEWNDAIIQHKAVWILLDPSFAAEFPVVRWFRRAGPDDEWMSSDLPPHSPTRQALPIITESAEFEEEEVVASYAAGSVGRFVTSALSSCLGDLVFSRQNWRAIPAVLGVSTGTFAWQASGEDGWL